MALKRPNLPSFASTDELSDVDITCSARTEPELISDAEDHALHSLLPLSSPNGDRIEMSADHEDCSTAGNSFSAACQLDLAVAAMTVHEGRDSLSADLLQDFTGSESSWKINENRSTDIESVDTVSARAPIESLHSPNSQTNTSRSPARTSCSRPYSLVEERAKRFGQKSSGSETRAINNGAVTLPTWKRPLGHSMMYDATTIHGTTAVSRHVVDDRPKAVFNPPEVDNSSTDRNSEELSWSKKTTSQAPPPAEIWSPPSVPMSAVDVLPGIFDEHTVLFEQSVRVEPSPERILGPVISQEEEIQTVSASATECALRMPDPNVQITTTVKTANAPRKLKAFFGDSVQIEEYSGTIAEATGDGQDGTQASIKLKDSVTTKATVDAAKGRKPWGLTAKSYAPHPVSPRPRKQQNDTREPSSSPKQKDHKTPVATPPAAASVIPSPPQPTWKERVVNPFKRIGSGSALAVDSASPGAAAVTGVIGVPLCLCQPGANEHVPLIVELCTKIVEEKGLENQGIYRVPGNTGALNSLIEELNKDPITLCQDNDKWQDVNVVSSLLKLFFRKLPESLITDELYGFVITAIHIENSERRMLKLKKILHDLPERNFETFKFLAQHLARVVSREEVNKMDARNLAIMFGPSLVRPIDDNMVAMVRDMSDQCRIVESIILHCDWFFSSWDEDVNVPVDEEADDSTPISGSNQIMLAKAESLANSPPTANREVHANVLQSIIQAANRKKRRDKGGRSAVAQQSDADNNVSSKSKLFSGLPKSKGKDMPLNKSEENLVGFSESSISIDETVSDTSTVADENEISLEIIRYPAYHFKDAGAYIVENAKPRSIRRAKSNDSLLTPKPRVANANRTCGNVVTTGSPQVATLSRDQEVLPQETSVTSPYTDGNVVTTGSPLVTTLSHGQEVLPEITSVASSYGSTSASYQCANTSESSAYSSSSAVNNCSPGLHSSSVYFFEG